MALYRKTTPSSYPNVNANNFTDATKNWRKHSNMYRKTSGNETASLTAVPGRYTDSTRTWRRIKAMYRFNGSIWQRIFYKNANQPFATEAPTIRYNAYLGTIVDTTYTDATAWWATDPYQPQWAQMGPGPLGVGQSTWYLDSNGNEVGSSNPTYLWGRDGLWANDTGASVSATFCYNTEIYAAGATNSTDDEGNYQGDKLKNNEAILGTYDGYYIWYKIGKTVGSYTGYGFSQAVYVTKQEPVINSFTMVSPGTATVGVAKTVTYSFSNKWWRSIDRYSSYIEWHELSYSTQTPDSSTLKATHPIYSTTYSTDNATTFSGTDTYTPVGTNKYIYAKIVYKNTWTEFPPVTEKFEEVITTVATQAGLGAFTLSNATKNARYYDTGTSTYKRQITVEIGKSENADRYELQVRGYGPWNGSTDYYFPVAYYTTLLTYDASPYTMESNRSGGILTATVNVDDYKYYEVSARAKYGTTTEGSVISTNTLNPPEVAPSAPVISSITTTSDFFGTYIAANIYQGSVGSNAEKEYEYSLNGGSFSSVGTGTYGTLGTGYINVANGVKLYVNEGTSYTLAIRLKNYDDAVSSSSNTLSITSAARPSAPTSVVVKSFAANQGTIFFTSGANTQSVEGFLEYDSQNQFDSISGYVNVGSYTASKIQLTGANSTSRVYTTYLRPYFGSNKTGGTGSITTYSTKVLSGGDNMVVSLGTPTRPSAGTINLSWTYSSGAQTHYICRLYNYSTGSLISTKTVASSTTSISFTTSDGVQYNTLYYIGVQPQYQYTSSVTYEDANFVSSNINSGANLTAPTSTSIVSVSRLTDSTCRVYVGSSGGSGPYYQLFWTSNSTAPTTASYDAAGTSSTVMEDFSFGALTYYFYMRSSNENLGNTINNGTGTDGTYSAYGPSSGAASYTFATPSGQTASISGSTSVGSTLTLTTSASGSPTPTASIIWRRADGGPGGNSFTGGSVMQTGGTSYVIDSPVVAYSSVGYSIRAEVSYNNGLGTTVTANSNSIVVTAAAVAPSNTSTPTLSPTTIYVGTTLTAGVGSWSGTTPITYDLRIYRGTQFVSNGETLVKSAGNVTSTTYTITQADYDSGQRYFRTYVQASNVAGSSGWVAGEERGAVTIAVTAPSNTAAPSLSPATFTAGSTTASCSTGTWSGTTPITYAYQWQYLNSSFTWSNISGATSSTYSIPSNFNTLYSPNYGLRCVVTASNSGGSASAASSSQSVNNASVTAPGIPTSVGLTGSGSVSWGAPSSGGTPTSYEIQYYTASNSSGSNAAGPYTVTGISSSPYQLTSPYGGANANYARVQVRARNSAGASSYSGWVPSASTYT